MEGRIHIISGIAASVTTAVDDSHRSVFVIAATNRPSFYYVLSVYEDMEDMEDTMNDDDMIYEQGYQRYKDDCHE